MCVKCNFFFFFTIALVTRAVFGLHIIKMFVKNFFFLLNVFGFGHVSGRSSIGHKPHPKLKRHNLLIGRWKSMTGHENAYTVFGWGDFREDGKHKAEN